MLVGSFLIGCLEAGGGQLTLKSVVEVVIQRFDTLRMIEDAILATEAVADGKNIEEQFRGFIEKC